MAIPRNERQVALLRDAADTGDAAAIHDLGYCYHFGLKSRDGTTLVPRNIARAFALYLRAAKAGNSSAMTSVASCYELGTGTKRDAIAERLWLTRAAKLGDTTAIFNLAKTLQNDGDFKSAAKLYRRGAELGDSAARFELALARLYGSGVRRDVDAALRDLRLVVRDRRNYYDFGRAQAATLLGRLYTEGWCVRRSVETARRWLRIGSKLGSAEAEGYLHDLG
jgi:TPR repeat protein